MKNHSLERINRKRFLEDKNSYIFQYSSAVVRMVRIGEGCQIYLNDDCMTRIDLWTDFTLMKKGSPINVRRQEIYTYSPIINTIGCYIERFVVIKDGSLYIELSSGFRIEYGSLNFGIETEPWNISDRDGLLVIGLAGGGVEILMPNEATSCRRNIPGNVFFD